MFAQNASHSRFAQGHPYKQMNKQSQIESYRPPEIKIMELKAHSIICISPGQGNDGLYEQDFGDGGFAQPEF